MSSKSTKITPEEFYANVFSEAERARLEAARGMEGIDEELAVLRLRLRDQMMKNPEKIDLLFKSMNTLTRAVTTRYKLSPRSTDDLTESIAGVINGIGRELFPEDEP